MAISRKDRLVIYQAFPRILTNECPRCIPDGTLEQNGSGKLNHLTPTLLKSLRKMGINTLWLTGVIECATKTAFPENQIPAENPNVVKGQAGSPYAIKDYYDVCPAIAENIDDRMGEFEAAVARSHKEGLKVIIDFVPNHTARNYHSDVSPEGTDDFGANDDSTLFFSPDNNYYYIPNQQFCPSFPLDSEGSEPYREFPAKATGNDCFSAFCGCNDWYETVKLNYGHDYGDASEHFNPIPDTWKKMLDILLFWASKGVDGFRCDMVFMVPLPFWHWVIPQVKKQYPETIFIGEIYDVGLYKSFLDYGCFDYLYDKVNLYDTLVGIERHGYSAARLTDVWQTVDGIGHRMLNFLENHDEVRFGSEEFAGDPSKVTPYLVVSAMMSCAPYMIYYGQELGESARENEGFAGYNNRSTIFDYWSYSTLRRWHNGGKCDGAHLSPQEKWLRGLYSRVLNMLNGAPALREGGFYDLMYANLFNPEFNPHSLFAFLRHSDHQKLLIVANFSDTDVAAGINIPAEAISFCGLPEGKCPASDLIADVTAARKTYEALNIGGGQLTRVHIAARSAVVLELKSASESSRKSKKH